MKKTVSSVMAALVLASSTATLAAPPSVIHSGLATDPVAPVSVPLGELELQATHGKMAVLPWIFSIVGLDLALIGTYWGVYVPTVAQKKVKQYQVEGAPSERSN